MTYPTTAPEIMLPELDGKTAKMYRGGKICLTDHFKPLWARNVPKFGIAHGKAVILFFFAELFVYFTAGTHVHTLTRPHLSTRCLDR